MARKDYYDWRGLAMFTQQMGQLFEPSKAKLLSKQQDHEMNMLMAKKAWETQSESLKSSREKYEKLQTQIAAAETDLMERALPELVEASKADNTYTNQTAQVLQNTTGKKLEELHALALDALKKNKSYETVLNNMVGFNEAYIMGSGFSKKMVSEPGVGDPKEYDVLAESDGIPGLSYKEKQKALNMYLKDTEFVLDEDHKDYNTGINQKIWDGTKYEDLKVTPAGVAFIGGYNSTLDKEAIAKQKLTAGAKDVGRPDPSAMTDPYVIKLLEQNNARIEQINNKVPGKTLEEHLSYDQWGDFFAKESARLQGWTDLEIADYVASKNGLRDALKEIRKRPGLDIPAEKLGVKHALSPTINKTDNPSTLKLFDNAKISTDILYAKILMKEKDDKYTEMITAYGDIMKGDAASTEADRQAGLNIILNWVNE